MINDIDRFLSESGRSMKRSAIREILKLLQKPEMISFAGGLPAPETFPVSDLKEIIEEVIEKHGADALQYGTTEGDPLLREALAEWHESQGLKAETENIIITTGSQQAIDLISRIFIDRGDYVLCGLPSYLGGLNTFLSYGARMKGIRVDSDGMVPEEIEKTVKEIKNKGEKIKFLYVIPDFQNPSGTTIPESRRKQIIETAEKYDFLIVEDCPYREIRFEGEPQKLMFELDNSGRVITLFTFSKIFAPGFRVGWVLGNPVILDKIVMAKQTADLCTSAFVQKVIAIYIKKGLLETNIRKTISLYRTRRDQMLKCLRRYMPTGVSWTEPGGGLFLFVTLPSYLDSDVIFSRAILENVAFVAGSTFFCDNTGRNTFRINFSFSDTQTIEKGIIRLASVIKSAIEEHGHD